MIEATGEHFLGEGDEVRWGVKVPVIVSPETARGGNSSLNFVDNHENTELFCHLPKAICEVTRNMIVSPF